MPWLARQLRNIGLAVTETPGWTTRGRSGSFEPYGVLIHHTAARSSPSNPAPSKNVAINGRTNLPGPVCHVLIDIHGRCHVIAAGRANHAGQAKKVGSMPAGDGNTMYVGIEIDYFGPARTENGTWQPEQKMSDNQYAAAGAAAAAILHRFGRDETHVNGHLETSTTGKIDPYGISMTNFRSHVRARLRGGPPPGAV
ncbi:MAG: N-acetylmuramoyl-L-alanine amidase [Propionibacteriales bacterium]|nr:N-acetylmuramoyl-L-alanine amidase [Propionibacteriales bacterium]